MACRDPDHDGDITMLMVMLLLLMMMEECIQGCLCWNMVGIWTLLGHPKLTFSLRSVGQQQLVSEAHILSNRTHDCYLLKLSHWIPQV